MGLRLTTHLHLVPTLRIHGAIPLLPLLFVTLVLSQERGKLYFALLKFIGKVSI